MSKNQQINYTTKPINLPLSTEKEYVLVYVEGYKNANSLNKKILNDCDLTKPFKFDSISNGSGFINDFDSVSVINIGREEYLFFYEVIRQPQSNEFDTDSIAVIEQEEEEFNAMANSSEIPNSSEWKNGDECEYYYWEGQEWRSGIYVAFDNHHHVVRDMEDNGYAGIDCNHNIRKPETPEQREERERLEAAYDLYLQYKTKNNLPVMSFESFKMNRGSEWRDGMLAIVDKTNYRLTK